MTAYALHLLSEVYKAAPSSWTFTILTTHKRILMGQTRPPATETLPAPPIRVERCFRGNSFGFFQLWLAIRRHRFDLVHIQHETHLYGGALSILLFPFFIACARLITLPVVTLHHVINPDQIDTAFARMHHTHIPAMLIRWGYRFFYRLLGLFAPSIIVHNDLFKETLVRKYGVPEEHIVVIPHGVQDPTTSAVSRSRESLRQYFRIPEDADTVFGFFGYFTGYKGIEFLLDEFGEHVRKFPKSVLLVGGLPTEAHAGKQAYQSFVSDLRNLADTRAPGRVIWYGAVRDDEVGQYFRLVDCLVLPYRLCFASSGPLSYAIGSSKPFLASEALRPIVPYKDLLFPLQKGALTAKLDEFISLSPGQKEMLSASLQTFRDQHRWDAVARATVGTYERSLERAAHRTDLLLIGAYGQSNLGDELLLETCLRHLPRHACTVASAHPAETESMHGVRAVPSRFSIALLRAFLSAKTVVVGGGDQFKLLKKSMHHSAHSLLLRELWIVAAAKLLRKKVYFVGVGIGTIDTRLARALTSTILRMADAVTLRDRMSMRTALALAPHAAVQASADLAFLEEPSSDTAPAHVEHAPCRLGIAPVFMLDHAQAFPAVLQAVGGASDAFLKKDSERQVIFLPFQTGSHHHHDVITSEEILAHMSLHNRCRIDDHLNVETAKNVFRSIDMLWGMRLHSIILACLYQVPFVALIYDIKVRQFLEDIDCLHWSIPLDETFTAEKLLTMSDQLETQLPDMRLHLHRQAKKLHALAGINEQLFRTIVADMTGYPASHCRFDTLLSES